METLTNETLDRIVDDLMATPPSKIRAIKELRAAVGTSLKESKDIIDVAFSPFSTSKGRGALASRESLRNRILRVAEQHNVPTTSDKEIVAGSDIESLSALLVQMVEAQRETNELLKDLVEVME